MIRQTADVEADVDDLLVKEHTRVLRLLLHQQVTHIRIPHQDTKIKYIKSNDKKKQLMWKTGVDDLLVNGLEVASSALLQTG